MLKMWDANLTLEKATTCVEAVEFIRPFANNLLGVYARGDKAISVWSYPSLPFPTHSFKTGLKEPILKFDCDSANNFLAVASRDDNLVHFYEFTDFVEHRRSGPLSISVDQNSSIYASFYDPINPNRQAANLGRFEVVYKEPPIMRSISVKEPHSHMIRKASDSNAGETIPFPSITGRPREHFQMTPKIKPRATVDLTELGPLSLIPHHQRSDIVPNQNDFKSRLLFFDHNYRRGEPIELAFKDNMELAHKFGLASVVEAWHSLKTFYEELVPDNTSAPELPVKPRFVFSEPKGQTQTQDGNDCLRQFVDFYSKSEDNKFVSIDPNEIFYNEGKLFIHNDLEGRFKSRHKRKLGVFYSEKRNLFPRLAEEIIVGVIESGEFIHGFAMYRLLKWYLTSTPKQVLENWEMSYFELLKISQLHLQAAEMALQSSFERVKGLMAEARAFDVKCPHCGTLIEKADNRECSKCKKILDCAICKKEITGLVIVCPLCGHGGHMKEIVSHFQNNSEARCPQGCDHRCFNFDKPE